MKTFMNIVIFLFVSLLTTENSAQNTIDVKTIDGKVFVKLQQDGKMYTRTYESWDQIKSDKKLMKFATIFKSENLSIFPDAIKNLDLEGRLHIKTKNINIDLDFSGDNKDSGNMVISINAKKGKKKKS